MVYEEFMEYKKETTQSDNCSYEEMLIREEKERVEKYENSLLYLFLEKNRGIEIFQDIKIDLNKIYELIDDSDEDNEDYKFAKYAYVRDHGQEMGISLFKIYKYITEMGQIITNRKGIVPNECMLILQKISFIIADMVNGRIRR